MQGYNVQCCHVLCVLLVGVRGADFVCFYDWDEGRLARRIDVGAVKDVIWSDNGELVAIAGDASFYILQVRYHGTGDGLAPPMRVVVISCLLGLLVSLCRSGCIMHLHYEAAFSLSTHQLWLTYLQSRVHWKESFLQR